MTLSYCVSEGFASAVYVDVGPLRGRLLWWACLNQTGPKRRCSVRKCSPVGLERKEMAVLWRRLQGRSGEWSLVSSSLRNGDRGSLVIQPQGNGFTNNWSELGRSLCMRMQPTNTSMSAL